MAPRPTDTITQARGGWRERQGVLGYLLISPTLMVMAVMLVAPLCALVLLSFWTQELYAIDHTFTLNNYRQLFAVSDRITYWAGIPLPFAKPVYVVLMIKSVLLSLAATITVILIAYPMAYFLAFRVKRRKFLWLLLLAIPFWTSYLLRVFAWKVILGHNGAINSGLMSIGIIDRPLDFLLYSPFAVIVTLTHVWTTFAILPIYVSLEKIDRSLLESATDLGYRSWARFWHVTLPLSLPGVIAAALLVFIPTVGDYITPTLVGGSGGSMIGNQIQVLFGKANDAPLGSAIALVMMLIVTLIVTAFLRVVGFRRLKGASA